MTARSRGISDRCSSISSAGTRTAPGSLVSASPHACGLRVSTKVNCSPLAIRSLISSAVTLVASMTATSLGVAGIYPKDEGVPGTRPGTPSSASVFVSALRGQPRLDPVRLAAAVVLDVRVPHRRQLTGGRFGGVSRGTRAIDDYLRALVRQK